MDGMSLSKIKNATHKPSSMLGPLMLYELGSAGERARVELQARSDAPKEKPTNPRDVW